MVLSLAQLFSSLRSRLPITALLGATLVSLVALIALPVFAQRMTEGNSPEDNTNNTLVDSTPTATAMATSTLTPTPTRTPTATPTFTPTPTPSQCVWVAAWNNWNGYQSAYGHWSESGWTYTLRGSKELFTYTKDAPVPSCFANYWTQLCGVQNGSIFGDCRGQAYDDGGATHYTLGWWLGGWNQAYDSGRWDWGTHAYYMDKDCKYVAALPAGADLCGFAGVSWSPISLILNEKAALEESASVAQFSLNPQAPDSYSLWKGSKNAPLLVFDPEHTGQVNSVQQLFGNWTFGGQTSEAVLTKTSLAAPQRTPWKHGYEALALLDKNRDKRIDGEELTPLALWFDENQDAWVDTGELRSLTSVGISALFYSDITEIPGAKDVQALRGFERVVDGNKTFGRSVDWYGESFGSYQEALSALSALMSHKTTGDGNDKQLLKPLERAFIPEPSELKENPLEFSTKMTRGAGHALDLTGFWIWTINEKFGDKHPGYFAIQEDSQGHVRGYSVVETDLATNNLGLRSAVRILPLNGSVTYAQDGTRRLEFEVFDRQSNSIAKNQVAIAKDGRMLQGKSTQRFMGPTGQSANVDYAWTANKVRDAGKKPSKAG